MFYDGQGFLIPDRLSAQTVRQLSGARICVAAGTPSESNLTTYFRAHMLELRKVLMETAQVEAALSSGRCDAFTADVSELGALRSVMRKPEAFSILPDRISKEPLAAAVRAVSLAAG